MGIIGLLALALALAMDAFAVAVASGVRLRCTLGQTLRMALAFGVFQFAMPVAGWFLGLSVRAYIEAFDHWVAFGLLAFVGVRMLREGFGAKKEAEQDCSDPTRGVTLLLLALATSIDALAVGISLAVLSIDIWRPAVVIGLVCFGVTALGMHLGRVVIRIGPDLSGKANIIGGLVLMGIGVKIVAEHVLA
ncbi:MAG: manganese efflux pump MntP family protein [Deltaproteobacteria bacterium]|jgi:putative Mn2+ efflux pump MntP|nr:manganese efflux pump MntP family protein [Deltaproteobacteria bacterium]